MKVIIQKDTKGLGKAGQVIDVADGYALNFLLPKKIVLPAHQGNEKVVAENIRQADSKEAVIKQKAIDNAQKIKQQKLTVTVKAGDKGQVFGSVTHLQIAQAITEAVPDIPLTHDQVILQAPITELGEHTIILQLHPDVQTETTITVKSA